ncbi:hypothetical protein V1460_25235 [Streptomyces sp. SCSIO 30461]|uniref:hypothetical protein n=1 Tax=Streptomyces sp. SCSIO 30461 TaxID=3118085 RepID=UPI0030CC8A9C
MPGTEAYGEPLAEAWHSLDQWAVRGEVLFAVNVLAERQAKQAAPAMSPHDLGGTAVFGYHRALPPAACLHRALRRRTGIHPWTFPAWN